MFTEKSLRIRQKWVGMQWFSSLEVPTCCLSLFVSVLLLWPVDNLSIFCLLITCPISPPPKKKISSHHPCFRQMFSRDFFQQINKRKKVSRGHLAPWWFSPSSMGSSWFQFSTWVYQDPNLCWPKFWLINDRKKIAHPENVTLWILTWYQ